MNRPDLMAALAPVIDVLNRLRVEYFVGGSIASSTYGIARATLDADVVTVLKESHAAELVSALSQEYYVDLDAVVEAIRSRSSFNLVHLATMIKIDVFIAKGSAFDDNAFARRREELLGDGVEVAVHVSSPEDLVIAKLDWYRAGGEISDRQWGDIVGVLKVQSDRIDLRYLVAWSKTLGLEALLDRALTAARD